MRILVAGGAGYVGSVLTHRLIQEGFSVRVLDSLTNGGESIIDLLNKESFELFRGDIRNVQDVREGLKGVDAVINLAALVGEHVCKPRPAIAWEINHSAAVDLAKEGLHAGIKRYIFASTCSNYGLTSSNKPVTETAPLHPLSVYAETKIAAEKKILSLKKHNFHPTVLRLGTVYGLSGRMRFDLLINELVRDSFVDENIVIYQPESWRPLLHIQDAAEAFTICLRVPTEKISGQIFNVGERNYQKLQLAKLIKKRLTELKIKEVKKEGDRRNYRVSFRKIRNTIGFKAKMTAKDGVSEILSALKLKIFPDPLDKKYSN